MQTKQWKVAIVMSLALLLVVALSAFAAPDASPERVSIRLKNVTIPWFFPPPEGLNGNVCPGVPVGYEVNPDDNASNRRKHSLVREMPNGNKVVKVWDIVTGTATDNYGNSYTFHYRNNSVVTFDGEIATVRMTDYFRLKGAPFTHTLGFKFTWQYKAEELNLIQVMDNGKLIDMYADFIWPTDDGVTETSNPALVPGSWVVHYDYGDWFDCDPI